VNGRKPLPSKVTTAEVPETTPPPLAVAEQECSVLPEMRRM